MRLYFLIFLLLLFLSCSNPLENKYSQVTLENDILFLKEIITKDEMNELEKYIQLSGTLGVDIGGKTYAELLNDIEASKIYEKNKNMYLNSDVKDIIRERIKNHICDDFIIEMNRKGIHQHNELKDASSEWDNEDLYIGY